MTAMLWRCQSRHPLYFDNILIDTIGKRKK
jgi:hypothetical protein